MEGSPGGALGPPGVSPGLGERGDQVAPPAGPGPEPGRVPRGPPVPTRAAGGGAHPAHGADPQQRDVGKGASQQTHTQLKRTARLTTRG